MTSLCFVAYDGRGGRASGHDLHRFATRTTEDQEP